MSAWFPTIQLLENPIGCWYCEMPETTGILYVELANGKTAPYQRGLVRVIGRLTLNSKCSAHQCDKL